MENQIKVVVDEVYRTLNLWLDIKSVACLSDADFKKEAERVGFTPKYEEGMTNFRRRVISSLDREVRNLW